MFAFNTALILPIGGFALFSSMWWIIQRRLLTAGVPRSVVLFASGAGALGLLAAAFGIYGAPEWTAELITLVLTNILLGVVIAFCYVSAVARGEASLAVSVTAFAPVLAIFTGAVLLQELPSALAMAGIVVILLGTYVLNVNPERGRDLLSPLRQIWIERSVWLWYAVGAAAAAGVALPIEKRVVELSNHLFAPGMSLFFGWGIFWGVWALMRGEWRFQARVSGLQLTILMILLGAFFAIANASQAAAYYYDAAASVGALKRLEGPMTVLLAMLLLGERGIKYRLLGTLIIAVGAFFIGLEQ